MFVRLGRFCGPVLAVVVLLTAVGSACAADKSTFHWGNDERAGTADLLYGDQPVIRYMYAYDDSTPARREETFKVFHHVFAPGTGKMITKGAGGLFPHHRGLFCAWRKTEYPGASLDFWHCNHGERQQHVKFVDMKGDENSGTMTAEIAWMDRDKNTIVTETRTVTVSPCAADNGTKYGWNIDWSTSLAGHQDVITLDGDRQHAGFQYRAAQAVAEANSAQYIRPAGAPQDPKPFEVDDKTDPEGHINLGWLAMTYPLEGEQYTIEYFEDPSLPKPSRWSERPYGRFGAFFKTTLERDKPLKMRYRVRVTSGSPPTQQAVQQHYDAFVAELKEQR